MKAIIRKVFWDFEKEEKWLNEMSAKGKALVKYSWCRYVFEETPSQQYIYRIQLLDQSPEYPESAAYIQFLEENGVECISSYNRWIYLRKPSSEGPFHIYTDLESRMKHYKKINTLWNALMLAEFALGLSNFSIGFATKSIVNFVFAGVLIALGLLFLGMGSPIRKKLKMLEKEMQIRE